MHHRAPVFVDRSQGVNHWGYRSEFDWRWIEGKYDRDASAEREVTGDR